MWFKKFETNEVLNDGTLDDDVSIFEAKNGVKFGCFIFYSGR